MKIKRCVKFPALTTRSKKKDLSKIIIITKQQKCSFNIQILISKVRKIYLFSNITILSDMLEMQDFVLYTFVVQNFH